MLHIKTGIAAALALTLGGLATGTARAQTCTEPAGSSFRTDTLIAPGTSLIESGNFGAVGMALAPDGRVFIAMMKAGIVKVYLPSSKTVVVADSIPTYANTEDGLLGIALDKNYATNHWVYAFYSDPCGLNCGNRAMELARFTYDETQPAYSQLTNKKIILRFPRATDDTHHAAGNISVDATGTLIIGTGDNSEPTTGNKNAGYGPFFTATTKLDAQRSSANTNDLRGKILRIRPVAFADSKTPAPGIDSTYTIPAGNLWEKINDVAFNPGWSNASDSLSKVRKEIFTFGHRNPFHPRVDNKSGWIFWGEIGPDAAKDSSTRGPSGHDEWNLAKGPGFYGHPYCNGYNVPYNKLDTIIGGNGTYGAKYNCAATVNNSPNNTGIHHMPPAIPALAAYTSGNSTDDDPRFSSTYSLTTIGHASETSIGGPMYRYDTALATSSGKFPPYYEGKIFFFDWARRTFRVIKMNGDGTLPAGAAGVTNFTPAGFPTASYIDMHFANDGTLYALRNTANGYSGGDGALYRIKYTGAYDNTCYQPFVTTVGTPVSVSSERPSIRKSIAPVLENGMLTLPVGYRTVTLYNLAGRKVWGYSRSQADRIESVKIPAGLSFGMLQVQLKP